MSKYAFSNGLILGLILVAFNLLIYLINPLLLANWWLGFGIIALYFVALLISGFSIRRAEGGHITLGKAFLSVFVVGMIISALTTLYSILLFTVIDPQLPDLLVEEMVNNMLDMFARFDMPMEEVEKALGEAEDDMRSAYSIGKQLLSFLTSAFGIAIGALIVGAIVKRNPPAEPATFA